MSFGSNYAERVLDIPTPAAFRELLRPSRYKGAFGGRGSGKSYFFADLALEHAELTPGWSMVAIREVQKTIADSSKKLLEEQIARHQLSHRFKIFKDAICTPGDGAFIFRGMSGTTADGIKSLQGFDCAWLDEAQNISDRSLSLLRPTIRKPGSEIWASWNPTRKDDAIDKFLRFGRFSQGECVCIPVNFDGNPWWTDELEQERKLELENYPERYGHTYLGEYAGAFEGAYFAKLLIEAKMQGRLRQITRDDMVPLRAFIDIGGAGAKADAFTIWIVQWIEDRIHVLDYYEARGQVLAAHAQWIRDSGYEKALFYLPHDGAHTDKVVGKTYANHWEDAGFTVETVVPNQGPGAASIRIENVRRLKNKYHFNNGPTRDRADATEPGRLALGFYHEKRDPTRNIGLGPEHDWASHGADGFGLMATCYEPPASTAAFNRQIIYPGMGYA